MDYSIRAAAELTGVSEHTIRAWEKRYGVVTPRRSQGRHRLYSEAEVERLALLRRATEAGHPIGRLAAVSSAELRRLVPPVSAGETVNVQQFTGGLKGDAALAEGMEAIRGLNSVRLEEVLQRAVIRLGHQGLLRQVIAPLVEGVGELWKDGAITAAHEHFATGMVRAFLTKAAKPFAGNSAAASRLVVATPAGQIHELGAVLVAAAAANDGWQVTYLGASLPAAEIAGAALQNRARAVALSIVYPEDDPGLPEELDRLRRYLPRDVALITGGRAAPAYREALDCAGALQCHDLHDLYGRLASLRHPPRTRKEKS